MSQIVARSQVAAVLGELRRRQVMDIVRGATFVGTLLLAWISLRPFPDLRDMRVGEIGMGQEAMTYASFGGLAVLTLAQTASEEWVASDPSRPPNVIFILADDIGYGDFGCYGADLMTWLMEGAEPITVTAVTQQIKPEIYPHVDDEATVILTYPKAQAILQASWNWPFDRKDMEVYGATGQGITVRRDGLRIRRQGDEEERQQSAPALAAPYNDPISYLIAVVSGEMKPTGLSALDTNGIVVRILDAARESARTGRMIRLADR